MNKIKKTRDTFAPSGTDNEVHPPSDPPKFTVFRQVSEDAVDKIIKTPPTKSCLLDPWLTFLIKECIDILLPSLTKLVNCSLMEGCVPDAFKSAVVTPLIKKPNLPSDDLKNYCPVSGLIFISKLVECVVAKQLLEHIHVHKLDNPYQSAYKACLSIARLVCHLRYHRSFHASQLPQYLVWSRWLCLKDCARGPWFPWGSVPSPTSSGKAGSCLLLVSSLQYRTLTNCMYWFPLPFQLPIMI